MWGRFRDCAHCGCRVLALFSLQCSCSHLCAQAGVCGCFQQLGICLDKAGCLNGTNEVRALVLQTTPVVSAVVAAKLRTLPITGPPRPVLRDRRQLLLHEPVRFCCMHALAVIEWLTAVM